MSKYGWQSDSHDAEWGSIFYSTPEGGEVEVSCITESPDDSGTKWPDIKCVGEVVDYLRQGKPSLHKTRWYWKDSYPAIQMLPVRTPRKEPRNDIAYRIFGEQPPKKSLADYTFDTSGLGDDPCFELVTECVKS